MRKAVKDTGKIVEAYCLGAGSETERRLTAEGRIRLREDGNYELFSLEAVNGQGELARPGDYFKLSGDGSPYPNDREFFETHHRHIEGDRYEQIPKPLFILTAEDGDCEELRFLTGQKGLVIDAEHPERYYTAPLWGTLLSAARDAVIVFYGITRDADGTVTDADFNFISGEEFGRTYSILPENP